MKFLLWERRHCADATDRRAYKGGSSSNDSQTTQNVDRRAALQDSVQATDGGSVVASINSTTINQSADAATLQHIADTLPDAVKTIAQAGSDTINNIGGAVVDLNRDTVAAQTKSFDSLVSAGAGLVDKLIDTNAATTQGVIASYRPVDGNNADVAKWAMGAAAAAVAGVLLLKGK